MMPLKQAGTRLCVAVTEEGVSIYGNKQAFKSLSEWMLWIAESNEADHFEFHTTMSLEEDELSAKEAAPRNVWVLTDKKISGSFVKSSENHPGFEMTFMAVENQDLDYMAQFQDSGILPDGWNQGDTG